MAKIMLLQVERVMFGALWVIGLVAGGYAAELPKKFDFSVTYFTNGALAPVVEFGEKQKAIGMDQTIMATNDKKEPFLNNMAAKCASLALFGADQAEGGGYCAFVDAGTRFTRSGLTATEMRARSCSQGEPESSPAWSARALGKGLCRCSQQPREPSKLLASRREPARFADKHSGAGPMLLNAVAFRPGGNS